MHNIFQRRCNLTIFFILQEKHQLIVKISTPKHYQNTNFTFLWRTAFAADTSLKSFSWPCHPERYRLHMEDCPRKTILKQSRPTPLSMPKTFQPSRILASTWFTYRKIKLLLIHTFGGKNTTKSQALWMNNGKPIVIYVRKSINITPKIIQKKYPHGISCTGILDSIGLLQIFVVNPVVNYFVSRPCNKDTCFWIRYGDSYLAKY